MIWQRISYHEPDKFLVNDENFYKRNIGKSSPMYKDDVDLFKLTQRCISK